MNNLRQNAFAGLLLILMGFSSFLEVQPREVYEVTASKLIVRTVPSRDSEPKGLIEGGRTVQLIERFGETISLPDGKLGRWAEVRNSNIRGYVFDAFLKKLWSSSDCQRLSQANLAKVESLSNQYPSRSEERILLIDRSDKTLYVFEQKEFKECYIVSISAKPMSNVSGSDGTPLGAHYIYRRIGDGLEKFTIFKRRKATDGKAPAHEETRKALVMSRILWLDGLETKNKDNASRTVYIHGTNREDFLGKHKSGGCIRMRNDDVIELFRDTPQVGTLVYLQE